MASIVLHLGSHKASKYLQRLGFHQKLGWGKLSQVDGKIHFFVTIGYRQLASTLRSVYPNLTQLQGENNGMSCIVDTNLH